VLSKIIEKSLFDKKHGSVALVSVDEPLFGLVDDPLIDRGAEGRESLLASWNAVMSNARSRGVETCIHLHSTSDDLFWDVESLRIVESHVDDPLYRMKTVGERLERGNKRLKASIARTDFDQLIRESLGSKSTEEGVAEVWKEIAKGSVSPEVFLEGVDGMKKRLVDIVDRFGAESVVLAGPECGLRGFPTYESALECLRRVSEATLSFSG
jgi:methionine synthase II (cobalamin-independent)